MKKILVATGTSDNKKAFAIDYIQKYISNKKIEAEVIGANIYEVKLDTVKPDVIITIGPANFNTDIPIIPGTCFVTKMGMDTVCEQIIEKIK